MDAVAPGPAADQQHQVAGLLASLLRHGSRHDAYRAAVDQRVAHITLIKKERAVGGGYAHAVAVIGDAGAHAFKNAARM